MKNYDELINNKESFRLTYLTAKQSPRLVLKNICDEDKLIKAYSSILFLENKSRAYIFASNKFEKSNNGEIRPLFKELQDDLKSKMMKSFLSLITGVNIFVDSKNHGAMIKWLGRKITKLISIKNKVLFSGTGQNY